MIGRKGLTLVCLIGGLLAAGAAEPSIRLTRVQQRYPWNNLVDVDFSVADVPNPADYFVRLTVRTNETDEAIVCRSFADVSFLRTASNGTWRATWSSVHDEARFFSTNAVFCAELVRGNGQVDVPFVEVGEGGDYLIIDLSGGAAAARYPIAYMNFGTVDEANAFFNTDEYKTDKLVLHRVRAGSFLMGSPPDEQGREPTDYSAKETRHPVTLTQDFYLGIFPVTQRHWINVMGTNPVQGNQMTKLAQASLNPDICPVTYLTYAMCRGGDVGLDVTRLASGAVDDNSFLGALRAKTGLTDLDLPTEAQWEYACRAGTETATYIGGFNENLAQIAWYNGMASGSAAGHPHPVGGKLPNAWGFFDMLGNNWEKCRDRYPMDDDRGSEEAFDPLGTVSGGGTPLHGASYYHGANKVRAACRPMDAVDSAYEDSGVRISMTVR